MSLAEQPELARLTVELLSAYVATNTVPSDELAALIATTRAALAGAGEASAEAQEFVPVVSVEHSLASKDHILSLIDGKPYRALKRHLSNNGLTPAEYKARYNLPTDYPMVSPSYSEHRRNVAKKMGLGGSGPKSAASAKSELLAKPTSAITSVPIGEAPAASEPVKKRASTDAKAEAAEAPAKAETSKALAISTEKGTDTVRAAPEAASNAAKSSSSPASSVEAVKASDGSTKKVAGALAQKPILSKASPGAAAQSAAPAVKAPTLALVKLAVSKLSDAADAPMTAAAQPADKEKPAAKSKPARRMARPKGAAPVVAASDVQAASTPTSAAPKARKKLGISTGSSTAPKEKAADKTNQATKSEA